MTGSAYDQQFYEDISDGSRRSAAVVVPLVLRLLPGVRSVVDFGCGAGAWLAEYALCGVPTITGLDFGQGTSDHLFIPRDRFHVTDLSRPVAVVERHDLAMSLEVAEHMPDEAARTFVRSITSAADLVMFSAATPLQGGHHHVNERWQSYWIRLFAEAGYRCHDVLRPLLWNDKRVEWWYRQNVLLFAKEGFATTSLDGLPSFHGRDLIHPENLLNIAGQVRGATITATDAAAWSRIDSALYSHARRVAGPASPAIARALRGVRNVERGVRRGFAALKGQPKATFEERWRARLERRLIRQSGLFDDEWYARVYPDVAQSGLTPFRHFLRIGVWQRRDPGPLFSTQQYLARHPWLAGTRVNPVTHFLQEHGVVERRG